MYEGDPYGDEIEGGDEDKNDGLNALVNSTAKITYLELIIRYWFQQGYRPRCSQFDNRR